MLKVDVKVTLEMMKVEWYLMWNISCQGTFNVWALKTIFMNAIPSRAILERNEPMGPMGPMGWFVVVFCGLHGICERRERSPDAQNSNMVASLMSSCECISVHHSAPT